MKSTAPLLLAITALMALGFAGGLGLPLADMPDGRTGGGPPRPGCAAPSQAMARLELLFGAGRADGGAVGEAEWLDFLAKEVTPRFPDGLTVLAGQGQWRNAHGRITREASRVLLIWHVPDARTEASIAAIRENYKKRFGQDSVMRIDGVGCVSF